MTQPARPLLLSGLIAVLALSSSPVEPSASPSGPRAFNPQGPPVGRGAPPRPQPPDPKQVVEGTEEDDTLSAGSGDDWMFGKKGLDTLRGGDGDDKIDGGEGEDVIDGGAGADVIDAGPGGDVVRGGNGDDTIDGHDDDDVVEGGGGVDDIDGGDGNDVLRGGAGEDQIAGGDGNDTITGDAGADRLSGDEGNDTIEGGAGDDALFGSDGEDTLAGDAGNDRLDGGINNDTLRGGQNDDTLLGGLGDDALHGGVGHDILLGGDGVDMLDGGLGHDWLTGGAGADVLHAGGGDDLLIVRAGDVPANTIELVDGGSGADRLILSGFTQIVQLGDDVRLADPMTGGSYIVSAIERVEYTQFVAQIDRAAEHTLSLVLVNPASTTSEGRVIFFDADGGIVPPLQAAGREGEDQITFTIPPLGSLRLEAAARGPSVAQVFATAPLGAFAPGGTAVPGAAAVAATSLLDRAIVPVFVQAADGIDSGALISSTMTDTPVKLTLYGADGRELDSDLFPASGQVIVPPYGHRVVYARDVFRGLAALPEFRGTMTLEANVEGPREGSPIAVVAIERRGTDRVAAVGAIPMIPGSSSGPAHVARITAGGGASMSVVLINPSANVRAHGTLRFFDEAGQPWAIGVNGQRAATTAAFDIQPRGLAVFATAATGAAELGSARAEAAQGSVAALVRTMTVSGAALLPASTVGSRFICAVRQDDAAGVGTTVSLSSAGSAARVTLRLRTAGGGDAPGGSVEIDLPANGQLTRSLAQLFPAATAGSFDGTLTVTTAGDAVIAASVTETGGASAAPAALPLVALP